MNIRKLNWPAWLGLILCIFGLLSYPFIFVNWPVTRDFPWANLLIFAGAFLLLIIGIRRAFSPGRRVLSKVVGVTTATLGVLMLALFVFAAFIAARQLPPSSKAPQTRQKAPDFTLVDTNNQPISLADLRARPIPSNRAEMVNSSRSPRGVLLIFYRGYW